MLCDKTRSQLLIIDVQQRLCAAMAETVLSPLLRNTTILITAARALQIPLLITEQYPQGLGETHELIKAALPHDQTFYSKTCFSSCGARDNTPLQTADARTQFVLTGMEAHVCVLQTALELKQRGAAVFVVEDAVCSRFTPQFNNAIARLRAEGVIISNTESVLFEWLRDANHPQFKALAQLIR